MKEYKIESGVSLDFRLSRGQYMRHAIRMMPGDSIVVETEKEYLSLRRAIYRCGHAVSMVMENGKYRVFALQTLKEMSGEK